MNPFTRLGRWLRRRFRGPYTYCVITDNGDSYTDMHSDRMGAHGGQCDGILELKDIREFILVTDGEGERIDPGEFAEVFGFDNIFVEFYENVFEAGELLVLGDYGREVNGRGRKPKKWYIGYEIYDNFKDALERSIAVQNAYYEVMFNSKKVELPKPRKKPLEVVTVDDSVDRCKQLCAMIDAIPREELLKMPGVKQLADAINEVAPEDGDDSSGTLKPEVEE